MLWFQQPDEQFSLLFDKALTFKHAICRPKGLKQSNFKLHIKLDRRFKRVQTATFHHVINRSAVNASYALGNSGAGGSSRRKK
jgi:hypothetical protein